MQISQRKNITACGVLVIALLSALPAYWSRAQEEVKTHKLQHKYSTGTKYVYSFDMSADTSYYGRGEEASYKVSFTGTMERVVVEYDKKEGMALIGLLSRGTVKVEAISEDMGFGGSEEQQQIAVAVYRMHRSGKPVEREMSGGEGPLAIVAMRLLEFGQSPGSHAPFPEEGGVAVGKSWSGEGLLPSAMGQSVACTITSTVTKVMESGGRPICVIESEMFPKTEGNLTVAMMTGGTASKVKVKSYFDVERGCERKLIADETSTMESFDMSGGTAAKRTIKLKSVKKLSADDLKAWSARVKAFDTALCAAYSNDFGSASDLLGEQIGAETHPGWKSGLETVRTAVKQMVSFSSGGICSSPMMMEEEPIVQELAYAEQAVLMGDWDAAVNTYEKFVANQPDHDRVPEALATAAGICESELKDEARAKALWKKLVEVHEKAVPEDGSKPADPMALYKLAGALAGAGRSKESLTKYNEFIKDDNEGIPARLRLLARYRQARICEEAGKVESAIAVYRAVKKSKATDSYSKKLAAKAAEKIRELEGSGPEEETHE